MQEILFVHLSVFFRLIYYNIYKYPSWRRFIFTLFFVVFIILYLICLFLFRLLDEIFLPAYKKVEIQNPIFIISTPRNGTTYLHRLMSMDKEKYISPKLYHTIFPAASFYILVNLISKIDSIFNRPIKFILNKIEEKIFSGWNKIHPIGLNKTEEDEGLFTLAMTSPVMMMFCPFILENGDLDIMDNMHIDIKEGMRKFYLSSLKRFIYIEGENKILLNKNVFDCGRIQWLIETFPAAKIICPVRIPYETIPSAASMFTTPWKIHSPELKKDCSSLRQFLDVIMSNALHFHEFLQKMKIENVITFKYDTMVDFPIATIEKIYNNFGMVISQEFLKRLAQQEKKDNNFTSQHFYSLEEFGLSKEIVYKRQQKIFEYYQFKE